MMRMLLSLSLGLALASAAPDYLAMWGQFKTHYGKTYEQNGDDEMKRFAIFKANVDIIEETNGKNLSYKLGVTQFADLTHEEFVANHLGGVASRKLPSTESQPFNVSMNHVPEAVDWVAKGGVTPVKDQEQCGSCWAFSATGAIEGALFVATNKLISLSEEDLVECDDNEGYAGGCNGGWPDRAFQWVEKNGICSEEDYPYTSGGGSVAACWTPKRTPVATITGFTAVPTNNLVALMAAVAQQPVSVAIKAGDGFQLYYGGILSPSGCGQTINHAVLVVGYGTHDGIDYWKVKNSWGPEWGEEGYARLQRGSYDDCGVTMYPYYPTGADSYQANSNYGDPAGGCKSGEAAAQVQGVTGDFCSPECGYFTQCPTDVPSGVTATPECSLSSDGLSPGGGCWGWSCSCVLVCDPSSNVNQCGKATCKATQGVGICTYGDMLCDASNNYCSEHTMKTEAKPKKSEIIV